MKTIKYSIILLLLGLFMSLESCGPVIISSRSAHPTPPWFYPNRVINVRYIYFPELTLYYDITLRNYLYFDNNRWIIARQLPSRYNSINLRRSRRVRVTDYFGDNIREYHSTRKPSARRNRTN